MPTTRQINRLTAIAAGVATLLLVTIVLPNEYGVDPTGTGKMLDCAGLSSRVDAPLGLCRSRRMTRAGAVNTRLLVLREQFGREDSYKPEEKQ